MPEQVPSQIGRYRIVGVVGRSATRSLYRAHDEVSRRDVWIWTPSEGVVNDPAVREDVFHQAREDLFREARIASHLKHPNIFEIREFGEGEGVPYVVSEAIEGHRLAHSMTAGISLKTGIPIILQVLDALLHMHQQGIVHRNIKPANIVILDNGPVKIMDFSAARLSSDTMTAEGHIVGTADYMSPEQVQGKPVSGRTDLFAVGCVLFELVTGHRPFHSGELMGIFYNVVREQPPYDLLPSGPEWRRLRSVITCALQKNPEDRYPDAAAMRADLELALKELGESAGWTPPRLA